MTRPKLLFLVTEDWYFVSHRLPLARAAREAGFDVAVATRVNGHEQAIRDAGVRVVPFELSRRGGNPVAEISRLVRLYRSERPALVHQVALKPVLYGSVAAGMARIARVVNAVAGMGWLFSSRGIAAQALQPLVRGLLARLLDAEGRFTIVQNPDDLKLLMQSGVAQDHLRLIRGAGVDTKIFAPAPEPPGPITVVFAARMLWDKGVGEFVEAARLLHQRGLRVRFALVGAPDPANPASVPEGILRDWHGRNGVEWLGHRTDMSTMFAATHIVCLPSYYGEGVPKTLLEAAASGRPIVTADAPGCREVVRDGYNGLLVPVRDPVALAKALETLIGDAQMRGRMGARGRALAVDEFSEERVIAATLSLYREMLA